MTPLVRQSEQDRGVVNLDTRYYAAPLLQFRVNEILTCETTGTYLQETAAFSLRSRYAFGSDVSRNLKHDAEN